MRHNLNEEYLNSLSEEDLMNEMKEWDAEEGADENFRGSLMHA